jgi:hypothetical protein
MAAAPDDATPAFRFKRRKIAHPRKTPTNIDDALEAADSPLPAASLSPITTDTIDAPVPGVPSISGNKEGEESSTPNLRDIIRQRKRPQDRLREAARRAEERKAELAKGALVHIGAPHAHVKDGHEGEAESAVSRYSNRFVAQTGQVVDQEDEGM